MIPRPTIQARLGILISVGLLGIIFPSRVEATSSTSGVLRVHVIGVDSTVIRATVLVFESDSLVATGITDSLTGVLSVQLEPGTYSVIVDGPSPFATQQRTGISISEGETTTLDVLLRYVVELNVREILDTLRVGEVKNRTLSLTNTTPDSVPFRLDIDETGHPVTMIGTIGHSTFGTRGTTTTGRGGPDAFGYVWRDSDEPDGPVFNWIDIRSQGTPLLLNDDQNIGPIPLGFDFAFYGNSYDAIRLCDNGFLAFLSTSHASVNGPLPSPPEPNNAICPFWDDLNPDQEGTRDTVFYYSDPTTSTFIVQYQAFRGYADPASRLTFEAILGPDDVVRFQYLTMSGTTNSATVGIENASGTIGLQVVYNNAYIHNGLAVEFQPPPGPTIPASGILPPDQRQRFTMVLDATGVSPGTYDFHLLLDAIHPDVTGTMRIPGRVVVLPPTDVRNEGTLPSAFGLCQNYPNPFNPSTRIEYNIPTRSQVVLQVFDVLGRSVKTLVNEMKEPGKYSIEFEGEGMASGVYLYTLRSGSFVQAKKFLLLR